MSEDSLNSLYSTYVRTPPPELHIFDEWTGSTRLLAKAFCHSKGVVTIYQEKGFNCISMDLDGVRRLLAFVEDSNNG